MQHPPRQSAHSRVVAEPLEPRQLFSVPAGFVEQTVAANLSHVSGLAVAPDGRVFIAEQLTGKIRVVKNGSLLSTAFATLPVAGGTVTGLLGLAVDPQFATNGYVYAFWTASSPDVHDRVSRFTASGDVAVASSRKDLVDLPGPANFHQGGMIGFGPDGKLYVPVGDHGKPAKAQTLDNPYGKLLRFNKDGTIPTDNPFYAQTAGVNKAIWATGLRNPFQFDFQPGTGKLYVNDVGLDTWEEVNLGVKGANYGWPGIEGPRVSQAAPAAYKDPIYAYKHGTGDGAASITGGAFYSGSAFPAAYQGQYFLTDYTAGWIKTLDPANPGAGAKAFATGLNFPIDLKRSPDGGLYVLNHGSDESSVGSLVKIKYVGTTNQTPFIVTTPKSQTVPSGQPATFSVEAGGPGTLAYQWQRNGVNIAGATKATYTKTATAADNGAAFRVVVSNSAGSATSAAANLSVVANQYPTPVVTAPTTTFKYKAGGTVSFAGTATDPEDGAEPAGRFTWSVTFHHNTHTHPFLDAIAGVKSGTFKIPTTGETSDNVWYRVSLTVTDAGGLPRTVSRDVFPVKTAVTLATTVGGVAQAGFALTLDGSPVTSKYAFTGAAGILRSVGAPASQVVNGVTYDFVGWSDGGAGTHAIATPDAAKTYTAQYKKHTGSTMPTPNNRIAVADTYAADGTSAGKTFGSTQPLVVRKGAAGVNRVSYLKFDLSNLASLTSASLKVYAKLASVGSAVPAGSAVSVGVYAVANTAWTEGGLTYNNRPATGSLLSSKSVGGTGFTAYSFDVSAYVKQQRAAGAKFLSLALVAQAASPVAVQITAREAGVNRPTLVMA